ncbi:hypothetical protein MTR67_013816 [Solanum verrucosum]|uniref:Cytochrome P450 n=1 Tax=Solanum verrucosum TaxID=315347 RepID=A0AAF0QBX9_SOLVR|nr:hypothetical protein MTR67_013816 [Solanum verrucosum]
MHKLQAELTNKFGENDIITESNITELSYLVACIKETLRIAFAYSLLDSSSCTLDVPERFLDSNVNFRGQDFGLIPFGAGIRIFHGLALSKQEIHLILASLIHYFEWSLPIGEDPMQLDMEDKFGVTLQKEKPLLIVPM